jgi:hypothetical protein
VSRPQRIRLSKGAERCRRKFLSFFPEGFRDETYLATERGYKVRAHEHWAQALDRVSYRRLLRDRAFSEIAARAVRIEARPHLLFSFEKMALRDAVRSAEGARLFAEGLYRFVHGPVDAASFEHWRRAVAALPRRQSRVLTWPVLTVFGFIARPDVHVYLKPNVTRVAAREYGFPFQYHSRPAWVTYASLLEFAGAVRYDLRELAPADMIDIQSFIWVQGSDEYT